MKTGNPTPSKPNQPQSPTAPQENEDLRRARELRRVIGDPRVRVEVPTGPGPEERPMVPASRRYQIG
jgi:hypothetical protein